MVAKNHPKREDKRGLKVRLKISKEKGINGAKNGQMGAKKIQNFAQKWPKWGPKISNNGDNCYDFTA